MINPHRSFATLAAIAAATTAHAVPFPNIVASSTVSNISLTGADDLYLDIDGDATNDLFLSWNSYGSPQNMTISNDSGSVSGFVTFNPVSLGSIINSSTAYASSRLLNSPTGLIDYGFQFTSTDGTHYGWLEFDFTNGDDDTLGVLTGAYYETTPGLDVTVTAVPEPASGLAAAGLAGAAALGFRQRRKKKA